MENITITAPKTGITFELKPFVSGLDLIDLEAVGVGAGTKSVDGRTGEVTLNAEKAYRVRLRKTVDIVVLKAGEDTEKDKVWTTLTGLPGSDYLYIMAAINRIMNGSTITQAEGEELPRATES